MRSGPAYPISQDPDGTFLIPEADLTDKLLDIWNQYTLPGTGKCDVCGMTFGVHAYDVKVDEPSVWAWVCPGCFDSLSCQLGPKKGQHYYRKGQSHDWRAVHPSWRVTADE